MKSLSDAALVEAGRRVLAVEAAAVEALRDRLGDDFVHGCRLLAGTAGRVLVSGVGKSGHVARKVAATLTSTGTPAIYLHPVEALHGDLGIVRAEDVALLVSKSGDVAELGGLVDHLLRLSVPIVAIVGCVTSPLAEHATAVLDSSVGQEAGPMDLVPTASTTASLAMGDALAMAVLELKGFRVEDFAALHPGGALGRKLSVRVADVMISQTYPSLSEDATVQDAIAPIAQMRGTVPIVDAGHRLRGVVTSGDLARLMERDEDFMVRSITEVMTREPKTADPNELGAAAANRMETHGVMALPVVEADGRLLGVVHLHDLMKAGAV
ncbi:MAG: KpsF/GutQ family sugar-phosphate isomerase [Gemmatimonadota bacterium]|nr:KpsF/GutQ family sugar-phosphate isomerase [Gemmatimonadota bacterium]MDH3422948.1 KpsF/GutQ family sugar-phosphate isomerase [Gemmatimonadota bacterium]